MEATELGIRIKTGKGREERKLVWWVNERWGDVVAIVNERVDARTFGRK